MNDRASGLRVGLSYLLSALLLTAGCFLFCGCSKKSTATGDSSALSVADGYSVVTDANGNTTVVDDKGNTMASSKNGDVISVSEDGTIIITDSSGETITVDKTGQVTSTASTGSTASATASASAAVTVKAGAVVTGATATVTGKGATATISGTGVSVSGNNIVISAAGTYAITGSFNNHRILVNAVGKKVTLVLNGADIQSSFSSALYGYKAQSLTITLQSGSVNRVRDAGTYNFSDGYSSKAEEEPSAAVYSACDMTVNGTGTLTVAGNSNNGLVCKDALVMQNATLLVTAKNNGVTGRDSATLQKVNLTVNSGGDALRANNTGGSTVGWIKCTDSVLNLTGGEDGIQAESTLTVESGKYTLVTGGGSGVRPGDTSTKGMKAATQLTISGGTFSIQSSDDALHSNGNINITGGTFSIATGDDGIHADNNVTLSGGNIVITKSYEGLEGTNVTLAGANVRLTAEDDGVNVCGGDDGSGTARPTPDRFGGSSGTGKLSMTGGTIYVNAQGDGVDINGSGTMTGGTLLVDGPTSGGNGALDYDSGFTVSGGLLVAAGSTGMAQAPSSGSTQNCISAALNSAAAAGSLFHVQDRTGKTVCTFAPAKTYGWICVSSPAITTGGSYSIYLGGKCTGAPVTGLYSGGNYSGGTLLVTLTASQVITTYGNAGMGGGMGGGMRPKSGGFQ